MLRLIEFFKNNPEPRYRVTLVGGVPSRWRERGYDAKRIPEWDRVYRAFDVISPWTVGRFRYADLLEQFGVPGLRCPEGVGTPCRV